MNQLYQVNKLKLFFMAKVCLLLFISLSAFSLALLNFKPLLILIGALSLGAFNTAFIMGLSLLIEYIEFRRRKSTFNLPIFKTFFVDYNFKPSLVRTENKWRLNQIAMSGKFMEYPVVVEVDAYSSNHISFAFSVTKKETTNLLPPLKQSHAKKIWCFTEFDLNKHFSIFEIEDQIRNFSDSLIKECCLPAD